VKKFSGLVGLALLENPGAVGLVGRPGLGLAVLVAEVDRLAPCAEHHGILATGDADVIPRGLGFFILLLPGFGRFTPVGYFLPEFKNLTTSQNMIFAYTQFTCRRA
jgi:hypothetical protein